MSELGGMSNMETHEWIIHDAPDTGIPGRGDGPAAGDAADRPRSWSSTGSRSATWRPSSPPGWSPRRSGSSPRTCTATSSTTPSTRRPPRSSSAASGCSPTSSTRPGETTGARTQGSSEAIMLGALSLKWKWRERREAAGKATDKPNLVFGGDVHVVWEKFCRYFDVEPRIVPLQPDKYTIGPEDVEPHVDENTIGVAAVLGTTFTGHADDIVGINEHARRAQGREGPRRAAAHRRRQRRLRLAVPLPRLRVGLPARAGPLDQRLRAQVRARLSRDRLADLPREGRPRRGPRLLRELPRQDRRHLHAQLLDRLGDGPGPVLHPDPLRPRGLRVHHAGDADRTRASSPTGSARSARSS